MHFLQDFRMQPSSSSFSSSSSSVLCARRSNSYSTRCFVTPRVNTARAPCGVSFQHLLIKSLKYLNRIEGKSLSPGRRKTQTSLVLSSSVFICGFVTPPLLSPSVSSLLWETFILPLCSHPSLSHLHHPQLRLSKGATNRRIITDERCARKSARSPASVNVTVHSWRAPAGIPTSQRELQMDMTLLFLFSQLPPLSCRASFSWNIPRSTVGTSHSHWHGKLFSAFNRHCLRHTRF